jgi:hypothetical protein
VAAVLIFGESDGKLAVAGTKEFGSILDGRAVGNFSRALIVGQRQAWAPGGFKAHLKLELFCKHF